MLRCQTCECVAVTIFFITINLLWVSLFAGKLPRISNDCCSLHFGVIDVSQASWHSHFKDLRVTFLHHHIWLLSASALKSTQTVWGLISEFIWHFSGIISTSFSHYTSVSLFFVVFLRSRFTILIGEGHLKGALPLFLLCKIPFGVPQRGFKERFMWLCKVYLWQKMLLF